MLSTTPKEFKDKFALITKENVIDICYAWKMQWDNQETYLLTRNSELSKQLKRLQETKTSSVVTPSNTTTLVSDLQSTPQKRKSPEKETSHKKTKTDFIAKTTPLVKAATRSSDNPQTPSLSSDVSTKVLEKKAQDKKYEYKYVNGEMRRFKHKKKVSINDMILKRIREDFFD